MRPDYLSYQRATSVSFLGLVIQGILAAALVIYGVEGKDHAALTAGLFGAMGTVIWLALGIVFDQARRERIEAIEAETLGQDAAAASVFEATGDEFRVAARRLNAMYKIFFPIISVLYGAALIGVGYLRFKTGQEEFPKLDPPLYRGWAIGIEAFIAVALFLFARYAAGMARQTVWANLKAGAASAAGLSLMCVALVVFHIMDIVGPDGPLRSLRLVLPAALIVFGVEVFVNFVLDIYRPRKAGESPRPAFNSPLLGLVASPETVARSINEAVNYQLGYDVSGTWLYRLLSRAAAPLILGGLLIMWGASSFTVIEPHQRAMVLRFGRVVQENVEPGLLMKAPWPIDEVVIPTEVIRNEKGERIGLAETATGVRVLQLATQPPTGAVGAILWTNDHAREEQYQVMQPSGSSRGATQVGSIALLSLELPMFYSIENVAVYEQLGPPQVRDDLIKATAQREIMRYMATQSVDDILGAGREKTGEALLGRVQTALAELNPDETGKGRGPGIKIISLGVAGVHPAKKVASEFEAVVGAEQNRQAKIDSARAAAVETLTRVAGSVTLAEQIVSRIDAVDRMRTQGGDQEKINEQEFEIQKLLDQAGGKAATMIAQAKSDRWQRHMGERARAVRYNGLLESFKSAPELFKSSLYFDALRTALADTRLFITSDKLPDLRVTAELQDKDSGTNVFTEVKPEDVPN
jgi:regulator of protease activity HflC (stomatin/prohibitin superfamily)